MSTNHAPASGQWHLILDDSVDDALYSVSECALRLDLANKKNVVLSFKAKSLGNEPDFPGGGSSAFDGISLSFDGGVTWRTSSLLAFVGTTWESLSVPLGYWLGYGEVLGPDVRIRFSEYDNASAPLDGIAIDDVIVTAEDDQHAILEFPARVLEGSGPHTGYVLLSLAPSNSLTLALSISPTGLISAPVSVVVPAGQKIASFDFSAFDDSLVNLTRFVTIGATASGVTSIPNTLTVLDDEAPVVTLNVPAQLTEGVVSNDNASVSLDRAATVPFTIYIQPECCELGLLNYTISIPAGQTQAVFTVYANDDARIDGNTLVTISAIATDTGTAVASNQVMVVDNEMRIVSLALPTTVQEGSTTTGIVTVSGTLVTNLVVSLTSSNPAALNVFPIVTIVAGETQATFLMGAPDNSLRDGSRSVTLGATANAFTGDSKNVTVRDNEVAGYQFGPLSNIVNVTSPLGISVSASDVEGNAIGGFIPTGTLNLSVALSDGTTLPLTPATVWLAGATGWTGNVTVPIVNASPLQLRATDSNGISGNSTPFDIMHLVDLVGASDLVWDSTRHRFYASVPSSAASGTNSNRIVVIDPASAAISGGVQLAQNPGQLALTSGGEHLYVALKGNGNVVRIDPTAMSVSSTFAVGTDPTYGTFYAKDMCTVAGQPNLLVISRSGPDGYAHYGVAVYDNGVARLTTTPFLTGSRVIEPSADPSIFFGFDNQNDRGFRRLQLGASGITEIQVNTTLLQEWGSDIVSDGNKVFSTAGVALDGALMQRLGAFPLPGPLRPDTAAHRVYFIEPNVYYGNYDKVSAYDPVTFSNIRKLTLPSPVMSPSHLIRWGTNGLAFLTSSNVVLINSSQLVPTDPPADLNVAIQASPNPTIVSVPVTYALTISNRGPNIARNTILEAQLSAYQTIQSVLATNGTVSIFSNSISLRAGSLSPGAVVALAVTALPQSAGTLACTATVTSDPSDPNFADNSATALVSVGYQLGLDAVNELRLAANNLIYDPTRNLLWASIPGSDPYLGRSVVSIDPLTGVISGPLAIGGNPREQCMALSANGRFLYVGLTDSPEVHRIDLVLSNTSVRIPLGLNQWGSPDYAQDIEPLDGDGTSFLIGSFSSAAAFDGAVRRPYHPNTFATRVEKTGTPGIFIGSYNDTASRLSVSASGVVITQSVNGLFPSYQDIRGAGSLVLSGSGHLINSSNLTLRANFATSGNPCLDLPNHRAYIVNGQGLHGFDTETLLPTGTFLIPGTPYNGSSQACVRWGLDGFAILGSAPIIYVLRWSSTIPPSVDSDGNGFSDAWEAAYFGTLNVDPAGDDDGDRIPNFLEYLFVTSPIQASTSPVQVSTATISNQLAIRLLFPRRAGLSPPPYEYAFSSDLTQWTTVANVSETVLSTQNVDGIQIENIEAVIPASNPVAGYFRLRWNPQ